MQLSTTRFGSVEIEPDDVIVFPAGMLGLGECTHWVLLGDSQNEALGWLQSTTQADMALAVVSPRRFVPDYQVRIAQSELGSLELLQLLDAHVLAIVSKQESTITLNLKAPLIINLQRRIGRQVINNADYPVQFEFRREATVYKKTA